jgi:putative transcriptional regulator
MKRDHMKNSDGRVSKRNLFGELREGMTALAEARRGTRTLRTHAIEYKPAPKAAASRARKS